MVNMNEIMALHESILYPTVLVRTAKAGGSGTVLYSKENGDEGECDTYVLTNHHVIEDSITVKKEWDAMLGKEIKKETRATVNVAFYKYKYLSQQIGQSAVEADVVAYHNEQDVALLKLRTIDKIDYVTDMYKGNSNDIHTFYEVYACGCSLGHSPIPSKGIMSSMHDEIDNYIYWMSTAQTIFGNSGGGMYLAEAKQFIGIPSRISVAIIGFSSDPISHMGYFIPIDRIHNWLKEECYQFIYDDNFTSEQCEKLRMQKQEEGKRAWEKKFMYDTTNPDEESE